MDGLRQVVSRLQNQCTHLRQTRSRRHQKRPGKLSPEARNTITIENEENAWGLDSCLELEKHVPLVLDIHHHWCNSNGEYISANDDRVKRVIDSWRGVWPTCHYSVSREEHLPEHRTDIKPDFTSLCEQDLNKTKTQSP